MFGVCALAGSISSLPLAYMHARREMTLTISCWGVVHVTRRLAFAHLRICECSFRVTMDIHAFNHSRSGQSQFRVVNSACDAMFGVRAVREFAVKFDIGIIRAVRGVVTFILSFSCAAHVAR